MFESILGLPLIGVILLASFGHRRGAGALNVLLTGASFLFALKLAHQLYHQGPQLSSHQLFYIDYFNGYLMVLTTFVGFNTALFSRIYMGNEFNWGRVTRQQLRLYYALYQAFLLALLLALMSNNLGLLWVAMEAATLATVLLVSLYRTPEAIEAAWKYFILCGVGIAQALFGTVLVFFAAEQVIVDHNQALLWQLLHAHAHQLEPTVMSIAFVFFLVGYGTKVGLVPLHNWLPDAHSEGPTPMSAVLSGLLLNVALYALVRVKILVDASLNTPLAGHLMMGFGLLSFLVAVLFIQRQRDAKRLFSYSSIEHMGLMTFAFGLSTPLATFAALLHMLLHSLTKSAIFITLGHAVQMTGSQLVEKMRGLLVTQPLIGWSLIIGTLTIAGLPPFGLFVSEFLLIMATLSTWPVLTVPILLGLLIAFAGLMNTLHPMVYSEAPSGQTRIPITVMPALVQLLLVFSLGLMLPTVIQHGLEHTTVLISGQGWQH